MAANEALTTSRREPARNARGVIAEHYRDLQSLGLVERARQDLPCDRASAVSLLRTVLQASEIALYNLADLLTRAVEGENVVAKLAWVRGFHRVLIALGATSSTFTAATSAPGYTAVRLAESPAFGEYLDALKSFDRSMRGRMDDGRLELEGVLWADSLGDQDFLTVHSTRIANHDSTTWEHSFETTAHPRPGLAYAESIASATLREAVYEHRLTGDTYFTQFRALHQIPELLAAEVSDRLEAAILALRREDVETALEHLVWANALTQPAAACLPPMVDNLATRDYHEIRENLGLTSGSHSVGIRYHLFTDLYEQLCAEVAGSKACAGSVGSVIRSQVALFRAFVFGWRAQHLHLPRNNLGGDSTRSLTGSPDAVAVVRRMAEHAADKDPAHRLLAMPTSEPCDAELARYLADSGSLDSIVLEATGHVTQRKFTAVQQRQGFFAGACPFTKPPRRRV
jgi:tryptophan 2,3-dioxygenase